MKGGWRRKGKRGYSSTGERDILGSLNLSYITSKVRRKTLRLVTFQLMTVIKLLTANNIICKSIVNTHIYQIVISVHPTLDDKSHDGGYAFQINIPGRTYFLYTDSESQFNYWIMGLISLIKKLGTEEKYFKKVTELERPISEPIQQPFKSRAEVCKSLPTATDPINIPPRKPLPKPPAAKAESTSPTSLPSISISISAPPNPSTSPRSQPPPVSPRNSTPNAGIQGVSTSVSPRSVSISPNQPNHSMINANKNLSILFVLLPIHYTFYINISLFQQKIGHFLPSPHSDYIYCLITSIQTTVVSNRNKFRGNTQPNLSSSLEKTPTPTPTLTPTPNSPVAEEPPYFNFNAPHSAPPPPPLDDESLCLSDSSDSYSSSDSDIDYDDDDESNNNNSPSISELDENKNEESPKSVFNRTSNRNPTWAKSAAIAQRGGKTFLSLRQRPVSESNGDKRERLVFIFCSNDRHDHYFFIYKLIVCNDVLIIKFRI